uniref:E3 ubiquitin-protein ligase RNF31 UBA-like domain-containing protein n=1 Tax=Anopheles maculatus TaxID=74869 RepID=A0A182T2W6_9DIPT
MDTEMDQVVEGEVVKSFNEGLKKGTVEIPTDETDHVEKRVAKAKVSTGCGPSPPREIVEVRPVQSAEEERSRARASIGTSPPPQDMSTQTYDSFEQVRHEIATQHQPIDKLDSEPSQEQTQTTSALYKRSYSLATPQLLDVERPASRNSISSDTQSLPPSPHELSPQPGLQSSSRYHANPALNQTTHPTQSSAPSSHRYGQQQDESLSYLDRAIHQIIQTAATHTLGTTGRPAAVPEENMYRTFNDLRHIDSKTPAKVPTLPAGSGHVQPKQLMVTMQSKAMDDHQDPEDAMPQISREQSKDIQNGTPNMEEPSEMTLLLREAERYQFTAEELQAAMNHCGEKHPVQWLRSNWNKLIETVQTLATKYGHEKRENTIGTISTVEAREALKMHKGNIWRAITECIEQRQRKYREIASKGNFTREDIVTSLTAHHGNLELALVELSKTQLKPFLMRIWGPPSGADNDSGNLLLHQALQEDRTGISSEIQQFISAHVEQELLGVGSTADKPEQTPEPEAQSENEDIEPELQELTEHENTATVTSPPPEDVQQEEVCEERTTSASNTEILKDIEALIMQMERKQESTNGSVLRNIQQLLTQLVDAEPSNSRSPSATSIRSQASDQRIMSKSPIPVRANSKPTPTHSPDPDRTIEDDVRDFVQENIQDILPNLVHQVRQELDAVKVNLRTKPKSLEDDIRETLMRAEYTENDYSNIHYFPFDKTNDSSAIFPERPLTTKVAQQSSAPDEVDEYANIQKFLERAIRNEKTTTVFDQMKRSNYLIDSSSDEARQTAESTDYYDLVSINENLMNLFTKAPSKELQQVQQSKIELRNTLTEQRHPSPNAVENQATLVSDAKELPQVPQELTPPIEVAAEKKGVKKRRGSRIPVNKNNYLYRRPVKSSSESDFEVLATNSKPNQSSVVAIDHVAELRHVVDSIERIEHAIEVEDEGLEGEEQEDFDIIDEPIYINLAPKRDSEVDHVDEQQQVGVPDLGISSTEIPESSDAIEPIKEEPKPLVIKEPLLESSNTVEEAPEQTIKTDTVVRLIQQMKDEINSDIATFNEDDAAYGEEYYEDEYEDEWEGEEEEEEEWDSNEEYDVDENGDFYEY